MGSLRRPVGPLPSSIYWRRRAALLSLAAVVVLLVFWAVRSSGDGTQEASSEDPAGVPAETISPGPSATESLIDERPGGRDDGKGKGKDEDSDGGDDEDGGSEGEGDAEDNGTGNSEDGKGGTTGSGGGGKAGGDASGLPACGPGDVTLSLRSAENAYAPEEEPELRLAAENASDRACRMDFGHESLTITLTDSDDTEVWSSAACPQGDGTGLAALPANDSTSHTLTWDRRHAPKECDGKAGKLAAAGTYLAEAKLTGFPVAQTSFRLDKD